MLILFVFLFTAYAVIYGYQDRLCGSVQAALCIYSDVLHLSFHRNGRLVRGSGLILCVGAFRATVLSCGSRHNAVDIVSVRGGILNWNIDLTQNPLLVTVTSHILLFGIVLLSYKAA